MSLKHVSQALRTAADALDGLERIGVLPLSAQENPATAERVVKHARRYKKRQVRAKIGRPKKSIKSKFRNPMKGKKYAPGTHWTQRSENKDKVREIARKSHSEPVAVRA